VEEKQLNRKINRDSTVLITGGSGLVGKYLTSLLLSEGYKVSHLSRSANQFGKVRVFRWDTEKGILDPAVFEGVDWIIHLAGENIGEKRWTKVRKEEIVKSRVDSSKLLYRVITENGIKLKAYISASAVGYYGSVTSEKIFTEDDLPGSDFLGTTCRKWEEGTDLFQNFGIRTIKIRTAVVLEKDDSALSKMMMPAKFGFLVQTGSGRQYMPWIHIIDLCNIYLKAIQDSNMNGAYNAVSSQHVTHKEFIKTLAHIMGKFVFPLPLPDFVLGAALGEMSNVVLIGSRVSSEKLYHEEFRFLYDNLFEALNDIINR
jgi:uncharacterized protein (TIGR01777 family)